MSNAGKSIVIQNTWRRLRQFTDARIGLGRAGVSLPTTEMLEFQLAHARARDAVHFPLDVNQLMSDLARHPAIAGLGEPLRLRSQAEHRFTYLQRPDLGRQLSRSSRDQVSTAQILKRPDLALVIADGLSSAAIQNHAAPFLNVFLDALRSSTPLSDWSLAPLSIVQQGRVAIGDDIGQCLNARMVVVLIGERPGLSSPDSLGVYLTYSPQPGMNDAQRNCLSNIRPNGQGYEEASHRLTYLLREADRLSLSGVELKDRSEDIDQIDQSQGPATGNFLIS